MSHSLAELKSWLLDAVLRRELAARQHTARLDEGDWKAVHAMAREHRLEPMLHWRLTREYKSLAAPDSVRESCARSFKVATIRSLLLQSELVWMHRLLQSVGIPHVALKGAWLAFFAYPHPGLRPLRDLDILVAEADVLRTYQALLDAGCTRLDGHGGDLAIWIREGKHLPPIASPSGQVNIEVHHRLYSPGICSGADFDLSAGSRFWQDCVREDLAGAQVPYMSPTMLLSHLIVHSVYDHQFDNGPLLVSDIGYLLQARRIDWSEFWRLAELGGYERGAVLALAMAQRYWGKLDIGWPPREVQTECAVDELVECTAQLMLRNFAASPDVKLALEIESQRTLFERLTFLLSRLFPPKSAIAFAFPVTEQSRRVYIFYLVKWWRLFSKRMPKFLKRGRRSDLRTEILQLKRVNQWLSHSTSKS